MGVFLLSTRLFFSFFSLFSSFLTSFFFAHLPMLVLTTWFLTYIQLASLEVLPQFRHYYPLFQSWPDGYWDQIFYFPFLFFLYYFFRKLKAKSFSIILIFSINLFKSLLFLRSGSFLIAILALCKLSKIAKLSLAKLKDPKSKASFISFSNLLL